MSWIHRLLGHNQWIAQSRLMDRRDYRYCTCGEVFKP